MLRLLGKPASRTTGSVGGESVEADETHGEARPELNRGLNRWGPPFLVAVVVAFNLIELRAERVYTALLNDGAMHSQMVREATYQFSHGHLPLDTWYPFLGLGSPQFLHYQSLGAMLAGGLGLLIGPDRAFSWSLYLLLSLWPISIYWAARIFGFDRWTAAMAALCSPFIRSVPGVGYETTAYVWTGYGVWAQLWAMWTLPLSWALSWQAVSKGRFMLAAVIATGLTMAFHFETGYLALLPIPCWIVLERRTVLARLRRGVVLLMATFLVTAWVTLPLILDGRWASLNELLVNSPDENSYGARQILKWAVAGQLLDAGRLPVLTILAGVGLCACLLSWKRDERSRAIVVAFALSLVLFFGRPTLGPLVSLLPASKDLFLRRFMIGVQLAAVFFCGIGSVRVVQLACRMVHRLFVQRLKRQTRRATALLGYGVLATCLVLYLAPAWSQAASYDALDAHNLAYQQHEDSTAGAEVALLVARMRELGPGRVYAGLPYPSWGSSFTVGAVPMFQYLASLDLDVVGYTLRTASLMTDPEAYMDESNPGDYSLFGIRYLVLPPGMVPVPKAIFIFRAGDYLLYEVPGVSYVQVIQTTTPVEANRGNVGVQSRPFLASNLPAEGIYPTVAFAGKPAESPTGVLSGNPGVVISEVADLQDGEVSANVYTTRTAAILLKVSFDPGWTATIDGSPVDTYMVAPAMVAITVGPGLHAIVFRYRGYPDYSWLFVLAVLTLLLLGCAPYERKLARRLLHGGVRE